MALAVAPFAFCALSGMEFAFAAALPGSVGPLQANHVSFNWDFNSDSFALAASSRRIPTAMEDS